MTQKVSELINVFIEYARSDAETQKGHAEKLNILVEAQLRATQALELGVANICAAQSKTNELMEEFIRIGRGVGGVSSASPEALRAKKDAMCSKGYVRFRVVAAFNGFGNPEYAYPGPSSLAGLVLDSICKVIQISSRDHITEAAVKFFSEFETTATRAGLTAVAAPGLLPAIQSSGRGRRGRHKTVRERVAESKVRVHDAATKEVVYAWMKDAPGFSGFRYKVSVETQDLEVCRSARDLFLNEQESNKVIFLDGDVHGVAFSKSCSKLVKVLKEQGEIGLNEMKKCLSEAKVDKLKDEVKLLRVGEDPLQYNETKGYLPQHLAYVVTKVTKSLFLTHFSITSYTCL